MIKASIGEPPVATSPQPDQIHCPMINGSLPRSSCEERKKNMCSRGCGVSETQIKKKAATQLQKDIVALSKAQPELGQADIAKALGCHQSTVYSVILRKT